MFTAALLTIVKIWKQPRYPSRDDWIKKKWYIYTLEYYSAIKKNEILPFVITRMGLEGITPSEISQKDKYQTHRYRELMVIRGKGSCKVMSEKGEGMKYKLAVIKTALEVIKYS